MYRSPAQVKRSGCGHILAAMAKEKTPHQSAALSAVAVSGLRDHNVISRQEGTCWWNMRETEGHRTGVNINTNTASQND